MIIRSRGEIEGEKMPRLIGLERRLYGRAPVSLYQSLLVDLPDLIFEHVVSVSYTHLTLPTKRIV